MTNDRTDALIAKYFDGTITDAERMELMRNYDRQSDQDTVWMADSADEAEQVKHRMLLNIKQEIFPETTSKHHHNPFRFFYAAAAILAITALGWIFFKPSPQAVVKTAHAEHAKIKPGTNKAVLKIAAGDEIILDHIAPGELIERAGLSVLKTKNGQIVFKVLADKGLKPQLSSISTPKGGNYEVVLPDGTKVWLNAATQLQFPTAFTGKDRTVTLVGEAYFEVAKNKAMPFKVKTAFQEIEVLGTHFNVMAYDNENTIRTTLLEGSVGISSKNGRTMLKPGQQSELNKTNNQMSVQETSTNAAVAWKNGVFMFAHEDMRSILNKVSRWYDVEIIYENTTTAHRYSGSISKFEDVTEVLKTMEMTGSVHFEIKGRRIYVMD